MKISRNSWHYKLVNSAFSCPSSSLCIYFWQIPIAAAINVFMAGMVLALVSAVGGVLLAPVFFNIFPAEYPVVIILGALSLFVWVEAVFKPLKRVCKDKPWNITLTKKRTTTEKPTVKKESLVYEYFKAKKEKVCPTIEFDWS